MEEEKTAKKKPHTDEQSSPKPKVISPEEAGLQFIEHLKQQPEKLDKIMDKVMDLDLEKALETLGSATVSEADIKLLGDAIVQLDTVVDRLGKRQLNLHDRLSKLEALAGIERSD